MPAPSSGVRGGGGGGGGLWVTGVGTDGVVRLNVTAPSPWVEGGEGVLG